MSRSTNVRHTCSRLYVDILILDKPKTEPSRDTERFNLSLKVTICLSNELVYLQIQSEGMQRDTHLQCGQLVERMSKHDAIYFQLKIVCMELTLVFWDPRRAKRHR